MPTTGEVLARLLTFSSPAICAAFRGDGGLVAVGFDDGAVRLCDPATAQPVGPPRSMRHAVHQVVFTSDGRTVAAIDDVGESRTWPVPEPLQDSSLERPDPANRGPDRPPHGQRDWRSPGSMSRPGASGSSSSAASIPPPCSSMTVPPGTSR